MRILGMLCVPIAVRMMAVVRTMRVVMAVAAVDTMGHEKPREDFLGALQVYKILV